MPRTLLSGVAIVAGAASLMLGGTASAAPIKVVGKVGPGYTISLSVGGKKVTKLKAGATYRFVISDRSSDHDFRLMGPGVSKVITSEDFTGTKSVVLKLRKGTYRFLCAPHSDDMRGSFTAAG